MPIPIELKPTSQHRVIDLVRQAGVDVSDWSDYKHGAKSPGANPNYCSGRLFSRKPLSF